MILWVIGRGGLLGRAISSRLQIPAGQGFTEYVPGTVPWEDPAHAAEILRSQARAFEAAADTSPWVIIWAAGAATTSTAQAEAATELGLLSALLEGVRSALPRGPGAFFLTSSAGGVYAGSTGAPFTIRTEPQPLSPYGELKLAQEAAVEQILGPVCPVAIGRISNLYGPGQNLDKLQGLISRLALSAVTRQPTNIFVSLDTIRDYIFTSDAADVVLQAVSTAAAAQEHRLDIIASGQPTTVGQLIRVMDQIAKRRVPVALGTHASAAAQSRDLRLEPTIQPADPTPLPAGVKSVYLDILHRVQQTHLPAPATA